MSSTRMSRKLRSVDWWDEPDNVAVVTGSGGGRARRRLITAYLWVSAILFPFLVFAVIVLAVRVITPASGAAGPGIDAVVTREAAQAQVSVESWLAESPSPLPGGRVVAYTGSTVQEVPARQGQAGGPRSLATYRFVLADNAGKMYDTSIQLAITSTGTVALADPALVPIRAAAAQPGAQSEWPWPGLDSIAAAPEYLPAVNAWARAYTGGDPAALKQVVGDPAADRAYVPLSDVSFTDPTVGEVGAIWADDQDRATESRPRQALLRVTVAAVWASQQQSSQRPTMTYDLLLDRADTAAPVVVAWGSAGTALTPYANAVAPQ